MLSLLCISDVHDDEKKLKQVAGFAKGCDALITAGDDLDREIEVEGQPNQESNLVLDELIRKHQPKSKVSEKTIAEWQLLVDSMQDLPPEEQREKAIAFAKQHPEFGELIHAEMGVAKDFISHYQKRAEGVNNYYKKAGIPGFGTAGNHDPLPALARIDTVKYLLGKTAEFKGLRLAGLPATGEWTRAAQMMSDYYQHLQHYGPVAHEDEEGKISLLAQQLLNDNGKIDVFVTHKAFKKELQDWSPVYAQNDQFGIDAGAAAVDKKFKPALNVFGHYHLERAKVKRSKDGNQWFLYVGPSASVRVELKKDNTPRIFESIYYN